MARKSPRTDISVEEVRALLDFDPVTGVLTWKPRPTRVDHMRADGRWNARYANKPVHLRASKTYRAIRINGILYKAHRIAWLHYYGQWPGAIIDHKDGVRHTYRLDNLREASYSLNAMNSRRRSDNASGMKGVDFVKRIGKWRARIGIGRANKYLGVFDHPESAQAAYRNAANSLHGEFARPD